MKKLDQEESEILGAIQSGKVKRAEGNAYQMIVVSILHKFVEGRLHEKSS